MLRGAEAEVDVKLATRAAGVLGRFAAHEARESRFRLGHRGRYEVCKS